MEEYKIIKTLESFKQEKPDKYWANFAKNEIISQSFKKNSFSYNFRNLFDSPKLAIGACFPVLITILLFVAINNPNNNETGPIASPVLSPEERLLVAIQSMEAEISKIPSTSEGDVKEAKKETRKILASASAQLKELPKEQKATFADNVVSKVKALEKNVNAVIMDEQEDKIAIKEFYKVIAENEITEIEKSYNNLTEQQKAILSKAKDYFIVEEYEKALEEVYMIQPNTSKETQEEGGSE